MREWYHFHASVISRGRNQSAVACAAYRSGERLHSRADGEAKDFSRRQRGDDIAHTEIMAPENAPDWVHDREELWNRVEAAENRKDAQLAREVRFALARELSPEERIAATRDFVREHFTDEGMVADIALHHNEQDHNPHAHIMLTTRELHADGFGRKAREWNNKARLKSWREGCARSQNRYLERGRHETRADHRSYKERGIELDPGFHVGPKGWHIGQKVERIRRQGVRNAQRPHRGDFEPSFKEEAERAAHKPKTHSNRVRRPRKSMQRGQTVSHGVMWGGKRARNGRSYAYSDTEGMRYFANRQRQADRLKRCREVAQQEQTKDRFARTFKSPTAARRKFTRYAAEKGLRAAFIRLNRQPERYGALARTRVRPMSIGPQPPITPSRTLSRPAFSKERNRVMPRGRDRDNGFER